MAVIVYQPKPGGRYLVPGLRPGSQLMVSASEAKRLLATGQFEEVGETPQGTTNSPPPSPEPAPKKGNKRRTE